MKKVTYKERIFLDKYKCIDNIKTRYFVYSWVVGGLTYFKQNQFNVFTIANEDIISIES